MRSVRQKSYGYIDKVQGFQVIVPSSKPCTTIEIRRYGCDSNKIHWVKGFSASAGSGNEKAAKSHNVEKSLDESGIAAVGQVHDLIKEVAIVSKYQTVSELELETRLGTQVLQGKKMSQASFSGMFTLKFLSALTDQKR